MAAELTETTPEHLAVIGVVPGNIETGTRLGPAVREAIPEVIAAISEELFDRQDASYRESVLPHARWQRVSVDEGRYLSVGVDREIFRLLQITRLEAQKLRLIGEPLFLEREMYSPRER